MREEQNDAEEKKLVEDNAIIKTEPKSTET